MSGKVIKVAFICLIILALGISFKAVLQYGIRMCGAQDARARVPEQSVGQDRPLPEEEVASIPPAPEASAGESAGAMTADRYDFSDSSNWNLTVSAWEHLAQKDFDGVFAYAKKCLELYEEKAKVLAGDMRSFSRPGHEDDFAVVNDVATSHYIMGEAYMKLGKNDEALKEFNYVIENYPYAQCWDPKGWFWKVAEVSRKNIEKVSKAEGAQGEPG